MEHSFCVSLNAIKHEHQNKLQILGRQLCTLLTESYHGDALKRGKAACISVSNAPRTNGTICYQERIRALFI